MVFCLHLYFHSIRQKQPECMVKSGTKILSPSYKTSHQIPLFFKGFLPLHIHAKMLKVMKFVQWSTLRPLWSILLRKQSGREVSYFWPSEILNWFHFSNHFSPSNCISWFVDSCNEKLACRPKMLQSLTIVSFVWFVSIVWHWHWHSATGRGPECARSRDWAHSIFLTLQLFNFFLHFYLSISQFIPTT